MTEPADDARHLRALLAERAQRTAELTALHEITAQLTTLRDPDQLLQDIANRARELLRVDVAYLALNTTPDGLTIAVVAGSMGSRLRGLILPLDVGIAGLVFTGGEPFWTDDYTTEPRIRHAPEVDETAREEHLGGILGVPLRIRDQTIGVLFAADRGVRPFRDAEVTLLSSLAAHAANAIDNARLYESQRRATALHERLTRIVVEGGGVDEILAALGEVLYVGVTFRDDAPAPAPVVTIAPVSAGAEVLGYVVAEGDLSVTDRRQLERGALVMALVLVRERALIEAERRTHHELVEALVSGSGATDVRERRARAGGLQPRAAHVVAVFQSDDDQAPVADRAVGHFGGLLARRPTWASTGFSCRATGAPTRPPSSAARSVRCWQPTPPRQPIWFARSTNTWRRGGATPPPPRRCSSTRTRCTTDWRGSAPCSEPTGGSPTAASNSKWRCASTASARRCDDWTR